MANIMASPMAVAVIFDELVRRRMSYPRRRKSNQLLSRHARPMLEVDKVLVEYDKTDFGPRLGLLNTSYTTPYHRPTIRQTVDQLLTNLT